MSFTVDIPIRFQHADAVGIVFYPQYFFLLNQVVEDWFAEELGCAYAELHETRKMCIPLLHCDCDFLAPSRFGEVVTFELALTHLGNSSFKLRFNARCGDEERLRANYALVFAKQGEKIESTPVPEDIRPHMERFLEGA